MTKKDPRILLIDLNNFARYPTISIGYLAAILRREQMKVELFSPLSTGVTGVYREPPVRPWQRWVDRASYRSAVSRSPLMKTARSWLTSSVLHAPKLSRFVEHVASRVEQRLVEEKYDAVFVSSYLMYHHLCERIGRLCKDRDVPMLVGGPYFAQPEVRKEWLGLTGLTGLVGGEVELQLGEITRAIINRESLDHFPGIWTNDAEKPNAPPLQNLDAVPFPDFADFPWEKYPDRIIPLATGRGCQWGACTFCSDITGTAGRTYRSRSPENVMEELEFQSKKFDAKLFVFTDPKLNSNLDVWRSLQEELPNRVPGAKWLGAIHIDQARRHGLTRPELRAARKAGMVRLTTGLESGSQKVLDLMRKGTKLETSSQVIRDAAAEEISVRVTMIVNYPGEKADDVVATAKFLEDHTRDIERVCLSRFHIRTGTYFHREIERNPASFPDIVSLTENHKIANVDHDTTISDHPDYRRAITRVLDAVHEINRRPLRASARMFDGVM